MSVIKLEDLVVIGDNVLVEEYEPETEGYDSTKTNDDKPAYGKVISSGSIAYVDGRGLEDGTIVLFGMYSTAVIKINSKKYYIIRAEDIKIYVKQN